MHARRRLLPWSGLLRPAECRLLVSVECDYWWSVVQCLMLRCVVQGNTPLMLAAAKGDMEAVGPLIAARANLEAKNVHLPCFFD